MKKFLYNAKNIQQYGPIFTIWLGPYPIVLICDYELAVDAMVKKGQNFVDRWEPPIAAVMNSMLVLPAFRLYSRILDGKGLASSSGDYWVEQRRFALHTLRNLGVSRNIMEERIMEEFHLR